MRSFVSGWLVAMGALAVVASRAEATAGRRDDMCTQPKMKTEKWKSQDEVGGMQVLIPPGFTKGGHSYYLETADSHFYQSGEHRSITIGSGRGPEFLRRNGAVSEEAECETVIAGRRVNITKYRWTVEDATLSASGNAGSRFVAVERFYALGNLREVFVALESNSPSDFSYYRGLFWTVTFPGNAIADASPATPAQLVADAPAPTAVAAAALPSPAPCAPTPSLPTTDALLDSSVVRMLLASAAPIPHGYEVIALQFASTGDLSGMSIAKSDLPDAAQHQLASVVATNLKPHDAHAPSTFLLRVDAADAGLSYTVLPISGCAP